MSLAEQSLSFDDLLNAVQESSRGRWFLGQYEQRIRASGTENILTSIAKLETVIFGMASSGGDAALVARAKAAIAAARKDIATLDQNQNSGQANLSTEARLFAKLADMARTSFANDGKANDNPVINNGVVRALRLVDELDQAMAASPVAATNYFAPHAEIFEVPAAKIAAPKTIAAEIKLAPKPETKVEPERGAKLTIRRIEASETAPTTVAVEAPTLSAAVAIEPAAPEILTVEAPPKLATPEPTHVEPILASKPRVVIIRRQPEDVIDMPMIEEALSQAEAATAA